jgi:hypothetical protein
VMVFPFVTLLAAWAIGGPAPAVECAPAESSIGAAYTTLTNRHVTLGPYVCGGLVLLIADPSGDWLAGRGTELGLDPAFTSYREAVGVFELLHETYHVRRAPAYSPADELAADCYALAALPAALERLHVPAARALELERYALAKHNAEPAPYAGACP